jgi:hypothetical protein
MGEAVMICFDTVMGMGGLGGVKGWEKGLWRTFGVGFIWNDVAREAWGFMFFSDLSNVMELL